MALMLVALLVGVWLVGSRQAASQVTVAWTQQSPTCEGTHVDRRRSERIIEAVPGMRCVITVRIHNDGLLPVHLQGATAPFAGDRTGAVVAAANADASQQDGLDASFTVDQTLGSGRSVTFDIITVFHPAGCNDSGTMRVHGWPRVRVRSLGLSHERLAEDTFAFFREGRTPGCSLG